MHFKSQNNTLIPSRPSYFEEYTFEEWPANSWVILFSFQDIANSLNKKSMEYLRFLHEATKRKLQLLFIPHSETARILKEIKNNQVHIFKSQLLESYQKPEVFNDSRSKVLILDKAKQIRSVLTYSSIQERNLNDILPILDAIQGCESYSNGKSEETIIAPYQKKRKNKLSSL